LEPALFDLGAAANGSNHQASQATPRLNTACALQGKRKSLPTLLMASRDLTKILNDRYSAESKTRNYLDQVNALTALIPRQH